MTEKGSARRRGLRVLHWTALIFTCLFLAMAVPAAYLTATEFTMRNLLMLLAMPVAAVACGYVAVFAGLELDEINKRRSEPRWAPPHRDPDMDLDLRQPAQRPGSLDRSTGDSLDDSDGPNDPSALDNDEGLPARDRHRPPHGRPGYRP